MSLIFRHLNNDLIKQISTWHDDEETRKRISIHNLNDYYAYVSSRLDYFIWAVSDEDEIIGELTAEIIGYKRVGISYIINPNMRNQGYCKRILKEVIKLKELTYTENFEAWVDSDNYPSIKCLEHIGFIRQNVAPDENELFHYIFNRSKSALM
ncbi:GNAT family N-acetyltransferase [Paenibacillus turpanensis]|uniref:GNAT family N-acetyltransferase n=1 Tax=Paenibacillus turpanensis TaxID=2689078 RepID=UPI002442C8C9|nr:GNAT family protein [Paenibacillus turpanensis]